jgi:predicted GNAT family N-acyltransferase
MKLEARVAATPDDIQKVFALRAAVFMSEQNCPYDEEFDGNDYCATHVLCLVDGEPAAVVRLRFFAEFAHLGRLAVLPKFRRTLIAKVAIENAMELCRRKGYRLIYGQSQKRLVKFWSKFGFQPMRKNANLVFSDHEYVEISAELPAHEDPIAITSDPYVIIRPEGKWDEPGVLDQSAARPPTNPH